MTGVPGVGTKTVVVRSSTTVDVCRCNGSLSQAGHVALLNHLPTKRYEEIQMAQAVL